MKKIIISILAIGLVFAGADRSFASDQLLYENFDDQFLDNRLVIYGRNWAVLSPPQYNLDAVGLNGIGYSFSSGTENIAYVCWFNNVPNPWPSDEFYVSFWMRYPTFTPSDPNENFKLFYPHWDGSNSYVHYSATGDDTIYYSARDKNINMIEVSVYLNCSDMMDGNWHHYEFYVKFSEGISRMWYDGTLKLDRAYGPNLWTNNMYYISAPSIDAEEPGIFSRQVDDWEAWDGMPDTTGNPGDVNSDGHVNIADFIIVARAFGSTPSSSNWDNRADLDNSSSVNIRDLLEVARHFGE